MITVEQPAIQEPHLSPQQIQPPVAPHKPIIDPALQAECIVLINNDFRNEIASCIKARVRWQKLNKILDVSAHLFQGTTTILAFVSASIKSQSLSIVAGCTGVCSTVCMSYSQYCKNQYKNSSKMIETMSNNIGVADILPDEEPLMNADVLREAKRRELLSLYTRQGNQTSSTNVPIEQLSLTPAPTPSTTPSDQHRLDFRIA